jgi:hypothetical protein
VLTAPETRADPYTPRLFDHDLDASLFSGERLDELVRQAHSLGQLKVQFADPGKQRYGNEPVYTYPRYPVLEDALARPIQYRVFNVSEWGGPDYEACRDRILELAAPELPGGPIEIETVVRVFSPRVVVALHGDPDLKLVCDIAGETVWYVRPPDEMTVAQHENLLRGGFFLEWWEPRGEIALPIPAGKGCFVPSRWAHWLDHPTDEPIVSFEMGFWSTESVRDRKVYDVNWLLRRLGRDPSPPGSGSDATKLKVFDAFSTVTRKGLRFRGIGDVDAG